MPDEIRNRILRATTEEEKERHQAIRQGIGEELPELKQWARQAAAQHRERVAVGTVFTAEESPVLDAIDAYATQHSLSGRGAVVRHALARLLGIQIAQPQ